MKVYLAFQKQPDPNIISKIFFYIIKGFTRFKYTHVEMFFEGMMDYCYFYSCEYFIPCNENRQDYAQNRV